MFELTVKSHISSAHHLNNYDGKCANIHGHNWQVAVSVKGSQLNDDGLLVDFVILKQRINDLLETLDHKNLNEISPFDKLNPTSENLAKYIFEQLKIKFSDLPAKVSKVVILETENVECAYWED